MRINKFVAQASGLSRRAADDAVAAGRVMVNGHAPGLGQEVNPTDIVELDGQPLKTAVFTTIMLNKPVDYICSRRGQGGQTIYDLLPPEFQHLKPVGRLDKDSSGLLLLTNDGDLANRLTHPRFAKQKVYEVALDKPLRQTDRDQIVTGNVRLDDGISRLQLRSTSQNTGQNWVVTMSEGRNRQIRRTFAALGYQVTRLHRTAFGDYTLDSLQSGAHRELTL